MTKAQARKRIDALLDEYGWSPTWPTICQSEYEQLCEILWAPKRSRKTVK